MPSLTDHQQDAYDTAYERLADGARFTTLRGYAGTGKTFVAGVLAEQLADEDCTVTACAPTHKATHVLGAELDGTVPTHTLHSFLGLRLVPDRTGGYTLEPEGRDEDYPAGVVIVDEASMIGQDEWHHIQQAPWHLQWLFVGDPAQLPPVNESASPVFDLPGPELETVHRQAADNPIIELAHRVRRGEGPPMQPAYENGTGVGVTASKEGFIESALGVFQSDAFERDATVARVLAYRNKTVRHYNRVIRAALYGEDAPRFEKGEWLVARATWYHDAKPKITNSEEVRVKKARVETIEADDLSTWKVWKLSVRGVSDPWRRTLHVLHESEQERFEDELEQRREAALDDPSKWEAYYDLKERFAQVDYAYATTVHKAQGSTFDTVFIDHRDLTTCRGSEQQALFYVAVTRPAQRLALLV